jgi:hypothetical protein
MVTMAVVTGMLTFASAFVPAIRAKPTALRLSAQTRKSELLRIRSVRRNSFKRDVVSCTFTARRFDVFETPRLCSVAETPA